MEQELKSETQFIPITESADELEETKTTDTQDEFSCPVCYTDGLESGLVSPSHCTHKICLECYTHIAARAASPSCPMCRKDYLKAPVQRTMTPIQSPAPQSNQIYQRPMSPNMNSDVMSLLIHRALPAYSQGSNIIYTLSDIERNQMVQEMLQQ